MQRTDVWIVEDDPHDAIMRAVGRMAVEDHYVLVSGNDIIDKARSDATLRDVSDATVLNSDDVRSRIEATIESAGEAETSQVLTAIRGDMDVYLPAEDTESAFRGAVSALLTDGYKIKTGGNYVGSLGDRDATDVLVAPMVPDDVGERILNYVDDFEAGDTFKVSTIHDECAPGEAESAVKHFLLANLGKSKPSYEDGTTGSDDPSDWFPGSGFRIPAGGWEFPYEGDNAAEMRQKWQEEHESGVVSYGSISFTTKGDDAAPDNLKDVAEFEQAHTDLQLTLGQTHETVADVLEEIPESATSIDITIEFE